MVADRRIGQYAEHAQQKDIQTAFSVFWCGRAAEIPAEAKKGGQQEQIDHRNQNRCRGQLPYTAQQAQQEKQQRNIICRAFSLFQLTDKTEQKNGYRSLHVIYATPVFLSSGEHYMPVEVQFRTIAMDYWASLEHALRYKSDLPDTKLAEHSQTLLDCARSLQNIEVQMQNIHRDINGAPQVEETPRTTK